MNFEQMMEIERERLDKLFELAEQNTLEGERARKYIDSVCWDYTHR